MKRLKFPLVAILLLSLFLFAACTEELPENVEEPPENVEELPENVEVAPSNGKIFLYGEAHGNEKILAREFELWSNYYHNYDMRHLFIEYPYFTAEFLNIWMQADNDDALQFTFDGWASSQEQISATSEFLSAIKRECPETVFHGTDVGHQYSSTGERYLSYLEENGMKDSAEYALASEAITQGKRFYGEENTPEDDDFFYREDKMTENFIREFDKLNGESVMGIYGAAHTPLNGKVAPSIKHPCMANQLYARYGDQIYSEDISWMARDIEPISTETFLVGDKTYEALYFGEEDVSSYGWDSVKIRFWRLENAYDDFAKKPATIEAVLCDRFPMLVETGQILVIDYIKEDGSISRMYYRTDGNLLGGQLRADNFLAE